MYVCMYVCIVRIRSQFCSSSFEPMKEFSGEIKKEISGENVSSFNGLFLVCAACSNVCSL